MSDTKETIFNSVPNLAFEEKAITTDPHAFIDIVMSRRSVRVYDGTPIPESVVRQCLDLALLAPNSSNLQAWEFYWVRDKQKLAALKEACLSQPAATTAAEIIVCVARTNTWKKHRAQMLAAFKEKQAAGQKIPSSALNYYEKIVPAAYTVGPWGIFAPLRWLIFNTLGLFKPTPRGPVGLAELRTWAVKTTALACENLMLAFRAFGFDSCPMEGLDAKRVAKILQLPSDAIVVMAISAGKRAANSIYGPRLRFDREQFIKEV